MDRTNIAERFTAFQRSTAGQQPLRRPRPDRHREDEETERMAPRPTTGQLFDHRRHDPLRFAALNNSQKHPPAPSTSGHSATDLSDARSIASSAFTLTSGTSASSASFNNPNSPLTQATPTNPFLQQLKRIYRDLCNKENRIVSPGNDGDDVDTSRSGVSIVEPRSATGDDVWLRRIRDHKDLVEQSHALLRMSLSPSVPLTIQAIPKKYNIPARLWSVGFHRLLESLRQASSKSPAAFEHLHEYIYYAYGFYSCLFEDDSLSSFRASWIEALGDLARYRMAVAAHLASAPVAAPPAPTPLRSATLAVPPPSMNLVTSNTPSIGPQAAAEFELEDERDIWRNRARDWYSIGLKDQPGIGKLHHHLGLLCRDEPGYELRAAYHFVKSMVASHPFDTARESIQPLFSVDAQRARMREADAGPVAQFVLLLGLLFTRIQLDDFDTVLARFIERLEIEGSGAVSEAEWIMIAVCCVGAMLEFGRPDGVIKTRGGLSQRSTKAPNAQDSKRDGDVEMEDAHEDAEDLSRPMQALSTSAPPSGDEPPHHFTLAIRLFCAVLRFTLRQRKIRAAPPYGQQYNPFLTVGLTFLASVITVPAVRAAVERHVPWAQLAAFAAHIVKRRAANAEVSAGAKGRLVSIQGGALPEDWCVRGTVWVRRMYMQGFWRAGRWSGEGDILDAMPVRDGVVEDGDIDGNGAEDGAAVLERGRCARLGAAVGAIVEHVEGMRWEDDVASRSRLCLVEGVLKSKLEQWEREEREEEEERDRRKRWGANNRWDMDVDEDDEVAQEQEESDDDMDIDEEIRVLKARRRELRARAAAQTSPRRKPRPAGRRPPAAPARPIPRLAPGYTVLVLDTNIFLSALPTVDQLVSSQRWTVVVPLAVVAELDGLSRQSEAAQRAISFLETQVRSSQGVGLGLKIQTSRGNYLSSLAVRAEQFWGSTGGWERNMDDFILRSAMWQMENFVDRSGFLSTPSASANGEGVKAKVVLVSSDRNLRVKARARELEAGDVNVLAGLM